MEAEQNTTQTNTQADIEATKAAIMAMREAKNPINTTRKLQVILKQTA